MSCLLKNVVLFIKCISSLLVLCPFGNIKLSSVCFQNAVNSTIFNYIFYLFISNLFKQKLVIWLYLGKPQIMYIIDIFECWFTDYSKGEGFIFYFKKKKLIHLWNISSLF